MIATFIIGDTNIPAPDYSFDSANQVNDCYYDQSANYDDSGNEPLPNKPLNHIFGFHVHGASRTAARVHVQQVSAITTRLRTHRFLSHRPFMK